jgi:hypothetical protein
MNQLDNAFITPPTCEFPSLAPPKEVMAFSVPAMDALSCAED